MLILIVATTTKRPSVTITLHIASAQSTTACQAKGGNMSPA